MREQKNAPCAVMHFCLALARKESAFYCSLIVAEKLCACALFHSFKYKRRRVSHDRRGIMFFLRPLLLQLALHKCRAALFCGASTWMAHGGKSTVLLGFKLVSRHLNPKENGEQFSQRSFYGADENVKPGD